jgi:hypothetical protein
MQYARKQEPVACHDPGSRKRLPDGFPALRSGHGSLHTAYGMSVLAYFHMEGLDIRDGDRALDPQVSLC